MIRLRYADEFVGILVILAFALFLGAAFEVGLISQWFHRTQTLRVILPEQGSAGLSPGSDVEVLGTKAGEVRRVVINPDQQMYAEADIDEQAQAFIRRDSVAVIRKRFGAAGAAYLDISRGHGAALDWQFAVIDAMTERDPTEDISTIIDQVRDKVFPVLDNLGQAARSLADILDGVKKGQGSVGRLLVDDSLAQQVAAVVESVKEFTAKLALLIDNLQDASREIAQLTHSVNSGQAGVPALLQRLDRTLVALQGPLQDLSRTTQRLPQIANNIQSGTANLPSLLTQAEQTLHNLDLLMAQLRTSWLLGGGPAPPQAPSRLSPTEVQP
jgi:phospholipid/cholesterol/gamma-HCH transport system substrate-binding protein